MYNEIIASKLKDVKYLFPLKNATVTAISKKNEFGDVVKFFAQINKEDIIQKISFKATGCSTFVVMSSYMCELVEGLSIEESLKIDENNLMKLTKVAKAREHVFPIVLETFRMLIRKYRKGIEKGIITPCDIENTETIVKAKKDSTKSLDINKGLEEIVSKKSSKSSKLSNKKDINDIILESSKKESKRKINKKESKESLLSSKNIEKEQSISTNNMEIIEEENNEVIDPIQNQEVIIEEMNDNEQAYNVKEQIIHIREEVKVVSTTNNEQTSTMEERKSSHLMALREKIQTKENHDKASHDLESLNKILNSIQNNHNSEKVIVEETPIEEKKEKKSLFSWFKKK